MAAKKPKKPETVFQWAFKGTDVAGTIPVYSTLLRADGSMSCNCPGWVFKRGKGPRSCKHTKQLETEAKDVLKKWKKGEPLPKILSDPLATAVFHIQSKGNGVDADLEFGRVIEV